jgi:hypothetical protein
LITLNGARYTAVIDETTGKLISWYQDGKEFIASDTSDELFQASFRNSVGNELQISASQAGSINCTTATEADITTLSVLFSDLPRDVQATVYITAAQDALSWRMEMDVPSTYALVWVEFPAISIPNSLKANGGEGTLFWPAQEGVVIDDLNFREGNMVCFKEGSYPAPGWGGYYPSSCQMQFMSFMQGENGLYIGCHDTEYYVKFLDFFEKESGAAAVHIRLFTGAVEQHWSMPYEIVLKSFDGDWHDAAEIYRDWMRSEPAMQHTKLSESEKLPEWVDRGSVAVCYAVRGEGDDKGDMNLNEFYPYTNLLKTVDRLSDALDSPIIPLAMHWEGTAPWAPPFAWPPAGSEESFRDLIKGLHERGHYFGVYCSGIGWTQQSMIDKSYTCYEEYKDMNIAQKACLGPRNEMYSIVCNADEGQRWGYDLCAAADGVDDIVVNEVLKIADSGCDYIQYFDQNLGGLTYLCYAKDHGHPPAPGNWEVPAMKRVMAKVSNALEQKNLSTVIGCEAAASEPLIEDLRFNDLRANINFLVGYPVPAYSYVYHEYVSNFAGNQNPAVGVIDEKKSPDNLLLRTAMGFISGDTITFTIRDGGRVHWNWCAPWGETQPDQDDILTLVKNMNQWRQSSWKDLLIFGAMEKPYPVTCDMVSLQFAIADLEQRYPSVVTSRWSYKGKEVQFLVNHTTVERRVEISLPEQCSAVLYRDDNDTGSSVGKELVIPPLSTVLVELK